MFGQYGIYAHEKLFGLKCDNKLFHIVYFNNSLAEESPYLWSRRNFLVSLTMAGATGALQSSPLISWAAQHEDPEVASIVSAMIGIDTHNHVDVPFNNNEFLKQKYDLRGEIEQSGFAVICMTFCVDRPDLTQEGEAYERFLTSLKEMDEILSSKYIHRALNLKDLEQAHKNKELIVIQSVVGGHFLEGKLNVWKLLIKGD
jgi:membrane dipeptidase